MNVDLFSLLLVVLVAATLGYKASFLKRKAIWHFSILQILYLVIVPGVMFVIFFSYIQSIMERPTAEVVFIPNGVLVSTILLSMLYAYGGAAIHAVTKMLSETALRHDASKGAELNKFFHLNFSHNLIFSGVYAGIIGLTLLELNHVPSASYEGMIGPVVRGLILGLVATTSMFFYTRSKDHYSGRWADLKATFAVIWVGFVLVLLAVRQVNPAMNEYQLLLPAISSFSLVLAINVYLVARRLKRGNRLIDWFLAIKRAFS